MNEDIKQQLSTTKGMEYEPMLEQVAALELQNKSDFNFEIIALQGISYNYPACCIYEFCKDLSENKTPFKLRGNNTENGYVPCSKCVGANLL
jgi:hypothetical protein